MYILLWPKDFFLASVYILFWMRRWWCRGGNFGGFQSPPTPVVKTRNSLFFRACSWLYRGGNLEGCSNHLLQQYWRRGILFFFSEGVDDDIGEVTSRAVPITSYSSSEDEEFFDADEDRSPKASPEWVQIWCLPYEPTHDETYNIEYVPSKDSDEPGHTCSLIRIFPGSSLGSQGPIVWFKCCFFFKFMT